MHRSLFYEVAAGIFPLMLVMWSLSGALYPAIDLCAGEQVEVVAIQFQERSQLFRAALPGLRNQPVCVLPSECTHEERTPPFR